MKTLTSIRASREVTSGRAATSAGVKSDDERGDVSSDAGTSQWNWCGGTNNGRGDVWDSDVYW